MKIYTRTGDDGTTGLFGGERVPKSHPRVQAMGAVDETNAALGVVCSVLPSELDTLHSLLVSIQHELFILGADIATPEDSRASVPRIGIKEIEALESAIDDWESRLTRLKYFILPGGTQSAAMLHLSRAICRRAERCLAQNLDSVSSNSYVLKYLNRLSDLLFVLARCANHEAGIPDVRWKQ